MLALLAFGATQTAHADTLKVTITGVDKDMAAAVRAQLTASQYATRKDVSDTQAQVLANDAAKQAAAALAKWGAKGPTLVVLTAEETDAMKSFRNIPRTHVLEVGATGVADVIGAASLVVSESALASLQERLR